MLQAAVAILKSQRHAIEFEFARVFDVGAPGQFVHTALPVAQFFLVVSVVEREHGRGMAAFEKTFTRFAADALGGRVGRDQSRIF